MNPLGRVSAIAALIAALIACGATGPVSAHEFWIEASPFQVPVGGLVRVSLHHGERFLGEPVPRDPGTIESFQMIGPDGAHPVVGRGGSVTSFARPELPGLHIIAYQSGRLRVELPAEEFEQYLREEGLEGIADMRAGRDQSDRAGREVYSRCAKALIRVDAASASDGAAGAQGDAAGAQDRDRGLGLPLEIVAEGNPCALRPGDEMGLKLLFKRKPLEGATVIAVDRADPRRLVSQKTDERGRAAFTLANPGTWMFTTIHMVAAPRDANADWESFWASLTFELPEP